MYTRTQYLNQECTHRQFYGQLVTDAEKAVVMQFIGKSKLLASVDEHLNDIPIGEWDALPTALGMGARVKATGDYLTLAGKVSIYKETARQIIEESKEAGGLLTIGEVLIVPTGERRPITSLFGEERVAALRALYRGTPITGYDAIAINPYRLLAREDVNWETAGARVTADGVDVAVQS